VNRGGSDLPSPFDFALLKLSAPANGIPTVQYVTDTASEGVNASARVVGYGETGSPFSEGLFHTGNIKVLSAPATTTCGTWGAQYENASMLCAGPTATGGLPATCSFDTGDPLVVGNPGGWRLIGINSWGPATCGVGKPDIYSRVSAGAAWLDSQFGAVSTVGTYHAIAPQRILDTRSSPNIGNLGVGYVSRQWTINPQVTGVAGVPVAGANGVVVNLTATTPSANGWLTVFPTGTPLPTASNLNFLMGQTVPNLVTVKIGQSGKISINNTGMTLGSGSVHIIMDIVGWFGEDETGALFHSMPPNRILDTRAGLSAPANPGFNTAVTNSTPITPAVCGGLTGVDAAASAVVLNTTVKSGSTPGHLTLWPSGSAPVVSNLNYMASHTIANLVIVKVGPGCTIKVGNSPGATLRAPVNVVLDVVGWFGPEGAADGGAHFHAISPRRLVDTRFGTVDNPRNTALNGQEVYEPLARDVPTIPDTAVAVIINLTASKPAKTGFLTLFPDGGLTPPLASNLNFVAGKTVPNLAIVQVHTDDTVAVANTFGVAAAGTTHVVMDAVGWFQ
jgi:hypothetical protein